jgi:predicted metal-dependent HD superfamily phosphohydrolase
MNVYMSASMFYNTKTRYYFRKLHIFSVLRMLRKWRFFVSQPFEKKGEIDIKVEENNKR